MKKTLRSVVSVCLLAAILLGGLGAARTSAVTPRYTGLFTLTSGLTISNMGRAVCSGSVMVRSGYTVELKVELKRDGTVIETWTDSNTLTVSVEGIYYVTRGHEYVVTTTATVYDANNNIVEAPSKDSPVKTY